MKECPYCGKENEDTAVVCSECSMEFPEIAAEAADCPGLIKRNDVEAALKKCFGTMFLLAVMVAVFCWSLFTLLAKGVKGLNIYSENLGHMPGGISGTVFVLMLSAIIGPVLLVQSLRYWRNYRELRSEREQELERAKENAHDH